MRSRLGPDTEQAAHYRFTRLSFLCHPLLQVPARLWRLGGIAAVDSMVGQPELLSFLLRVYSPAALIFFSQAAHATVFKP